MTIKTKLRKRIIPIILVDRYQVVTSKSFSDYRNFGNLEQTVEIFNLRNVDELVVLDISSSNNNLGIDENILRIMSKNTIMPFSYGGGIKTLHDIEKCLKIGCDKVVINYCNLYDKILLKNSIKDFGKQTIIVSIDYKKIDGKELIFDHVKDMATNIKLSEYIDIINNIGCGEILLTNVANDGQLDGYDYDIIQKFRSKIDCPIIINGGCNSPENMHEAFLKGADACGAGSLFYYTKYSYRDIKDFLKKKNVNVR